jgi:hypothetical protein
VSAHPEETTTHAPEAVGDVRPRCECHDLPMHRHGTYRDGRPRYACPEKPRQQLLRRRNLSGRPLCFCDSCHGAPKYVKERFPHGRVKYVCAAKVKRRAVRVYRETGQDKRRVERNRAIVAAEVLARGAGCEDCSIPFTRFDPKDGFVFHHRSPALKTMEISQLVGKGKSVKRLRAELAVCRLLCARCHAERHETRMLAA